MNGPMDSNHISVGASEFFLLVSKFPGRPPGLVAIEGTVPKFSTRARAEEVARDLAGCGCEVRVISDESLQAAIIQAFDAAGAVAPGDVDAVQIDGPVNPMGADVLEMARRIADCETTTETWRLRASYEVARAFVALRAAYNKAAIAPRGG